LNYKPFDKTLFDENDLKARNAAKKLISSLGFNVLENKDRYGPDLVCHNSKGAWYVEVEIKHSWKGEFTFKDVNIPYRKLKFCNLNFDCMFIMFNTDLTKAITFSGEELKKSEVFILDNKLMKQEKFLKVQLNKIRCYDL
jgi:hypothetical protein